MTAPSEHDAQAEQQMVIVTCPSCGSTEDLEGRRVGDSLAVSCGACGHTWQRDLTPTCSACGSTDLVAVPTATLEEAGRGQQRTPSGIRNVFRCYRCGARDATSPSAVRDPDWQAQRARPVTAARERGEEPPAARGPSAAQEQVDSAFGRFAVGRTVGGRWRLHEMLHWSTTGSLWLARAVDSDRRVLFKLVHPHLTEQLRRGGAYASSAAVVARVNHEHLLPVFGVKVQDGDVLVVAAATAGSMLSTSNRLDSQQLAVVGRHAAEALAAVHAEDVAHLDVRPEKIRLTPNGDALLVDLGTGRVRSAARTSASEDERRLAFQAPEQIVAHEHGPAADVYSLGLTLWSLAGGDLGRMGANAAGQASHRFSHDVPPLEDPALPRAVRDAIAAATRRSPGDRPNAAVLAELLAGG